MSDQDDIIAMRRFQLAFWLLGWGLVYFMWQRPDFPGPHHPLIALFAWFLIWPKLGAIYLAALLVVLAYWRNEPNPQAGPVLKALFWVFCAIVVIKWLSQWEWS